VIDAAPLHHLLHHAQQILTPGNTNDILAALCGQVRAVTAARRVFASFSLPRQAWTDGFQVEHDEGGTRPAAPAARSALFALHRRMLASPRIFEVVRGDDTTAIVAGLRAEPDTSIRAVPIFHRGGRVSGELVIVGGDVFSLATIAELAELAAIGLESAQRLAFARRDQDRLLLLAEAADDALYDWNFDTRSFWWGGGIRKLIGSEAASVDNTPSWKHERVHPDDVGRVKASFETAKQSIAMRWEGAYRFRRDDGSYCHVEDRAYLMRDVDGRAYRVIGSMRDVTAIKELLIREQAARSEAEMASRAKDEFLAMLGHELRNPLAPIITGLELLRMRTSIDPARDLQVLERQARHLIRLVDDLLDISRITHGKIKLELERLEVATVIAAAAETAGPLIESRSHRLHIDVATSGLPVRADRARLTQAIANIVMNAAKYTEPGGDIWITARVAGGQIEIRVRDNGIGIAPEMLPNIFKMFVQERQALDRAQGGLGLGLAIVHNLITLHGGTVEPRSDGPGRGTELTIRLPLVTNEQVRAPTASRVEPDPSLHGRRIMVVDDNEDAADLLAMLLEELGNTTRVAHDAERAIEVANEFAPELAVLDIGLPQVDGYELARRLRARGDAKLHLIALTGYGQPSDKERATRAGFDAHLVKPVSISALRDAIDKL
jgi:PAS domain S-box-containing protein